MRKAMAMAVATLMAALLLPPPASAQDSEVVFDDDFTADMGWVAAFSGGILAECVDSTWGSDDEAAKYCGIGDGSGGVGAYDDAATLTLTSPAIELAGGALGVPTELSADIYGSSEPDFDFFYTEISADGGTWFTLGAFSFDDSHALGYVTDVFDLAAFESSLTSASAFVRFRFESDSNSNPGLGWWVDNVILMAKAAPVPPTPPPPPANPFPPVEVFFPFINSSAPPVVADLITNAGAQIEVGLNLSKYDTTGFALPIQAVTATVTTNTGTNLLKVMAHSPGTDTWSTSYSVNNVKLLKGTGAITLHVRDNDGVLHVLDSHALSVTAADNTPPAMASANGVSPIRIGQGGNVKLAVFDALLRDVTYQASWMASPVTLAHPYGLGASFFAEGSQTLTYKARDRAGNSATFAIEVVRDTQAPLVGAALPEHVYLGVPFDLQLQGSDVSPYSVLAIYQGAQQIVKAPAGSSSSSLSFTPTSLGQTSLAILSRDILGHSIEFTLPVLVEQAVTDVTVALQQTSTKTPLANEPVTLEATLEQKGGVTDIAFEVFLDIGDGIILSASGVDAEPQALGEDGDGDAEGIFQITVPKNGTKNITFRVLFPPGLNHPEIIVTTPAHVIEVDADNQVTDLELEVFLGKVVYQSREYFIRSSQQGLPLSAVDKAGRTYDLSLDQDTGTTRYNFHADGVDLYWDPLQQVTTITPQQTDTATKDSPAAGLLAALTLVGAAMVLARRRQIR